MPLQPVTSAAMNGIGYAPLGPVEGTTVVIMFADADQQQPIMLGTVGGIPNQPAPIDSDDNAPIPVSSKTSDIILRTVPGPTTGRILTFYDPETNKTNLTSELKANMRVIGFELPKETFIVSINSATQITISNAVTNYGENILTFEDPPTNLEFLNSTKNRLVDSSGNPVTSGSGEPIVTDSGTSTVKSSPANDSIPTSPPPKSSPNAAKSEQGIKALIAACDKVGLKTKEQKCALLGIVGGECRWIPQLESFTYSPARLKEIYSFATPEDIEKYSYASRKGITREQFFSWAYGTTKRGKGFLGNQSDADGGKYFGRGFIQLTGRGNYTRYQKLANQMGLNIDIVNNPDSIDDDINVSALIAALFIKDLVKKVPESAHPAYFLAAKKAVGVNSANIAALKQSYYEYFYGKPGTGGEEKDAAPPVAEPPKDGDINIPGPSQKSIETGSFTTGFRDPNNKYPLKEYIGEPDTNRLSRGVIEGTIVKKKDANRARAIPKALDLGSWDQPETVYGAKYPFNKVFETESGHVQEFDDTPGYERINTYHRSGTFTEIDPNGVQVNYIVGDNFTIIEKNGCISVRGECNITVDGNTNIYARTDANIQVEQNATIKVGNNIDAGAIGIKSQAGLDIQAAAGFSAKGSTINVEAEGEANYLSGASTRMDYSEGHFGNGAAGANAVEGVPLTPPPAGNPVNPVVPYAVPPEREFEEKTIAETPEDFDTPEGRRATAEQIRTEGVIGAPAPVAEEEAPKPTGAKAATEVPVDCKIIYTTKEFTHDYRLSKNFTVGMLIKNHTLHKLVDQTLKESAAAGGGTRLYTVGEIVCNMAQLAQNLLEPALEVLPGGIGGYKKQWQINSGYRLRGAIGAIESATSDHPKGRAVDIGILLPDRIGKTYEYIQKLEKIIPYDQLILEYRYSSSVWIHASYNAKTSRRRAFTMVNDAPYKQSGFVLLNNIPPKAA
jgi:predicted chitinase